MVKEHSSEETKISETVIKKRGLRIYNLRENSLLENNHLRELKPKIYKSFYQIEHISNY